MTTIENPTGCPITHLTEVNVPSAPAGWHFDNFDAKREQAAVHTGDAGGHQYHLLTRMADIRKAFQTSDIFTSEAVTVGDPNPPFRWIPLMLDGSVHVAWRQLLGPLWTAAAVEKMVPKLRRRFTEVLDAVAAKGSCDFVQDIALLFPNVIFMDLMGLPREDADQFQAWEVTILHGGGADGPDPDRQFNAMMEVVGYFSDLIVKRRAEPRDDMVSYVLASQIDGAPIPDKDILDLCLLMFMAGLDTVAAQLTYTFWHLATHDEDRRRMVAEPSLIATAIEESLRYYAFVVTGRKVATDIEIGGCPVKAGEMVMLPITSANRDPREFERADEFVIDREVNRHIAFGAGPHRCLGSHLARKEMQIAVEMWHERIPEYRLAPGGEVREHGGQIGIDSLHLVWDV